MIALRDAGTRCCVRGRSSSGSTGRARSGSTRSSSSRSTATGRVLHPGAGRGPGRARLRHQPRGRPALRRAGRACARRLVARRSASPIRSSWSRPARAAAGSPPTCSRPRPRARRALRYVLVERSPALRAAQRDLLALEPFEDALGPDASRDDDDAPVPVDGHGSDRHRARRAPGGARSTAWCSPTSCSTTSRSGSSSAPTTAGSRCASAADGDALVESARARGRRARRPRPTSWSRDACPSARASRCRPRSSSGCARARSRCAAACSSSSTTPRPAPSSSSAAQHGWLRTYRGHDRGASPLVAPGEQDITIDVPRRVPGARRRAAPGSTLERDVDPGRVAARRSASTTSSPRRATQWDARAHVGDLEALRHRSRVTEAAALARSRRPRRPPRPRLPPTRVSGRELRRVSASTAAVADDRRTRGGLGWRTKSDTIESLLGGGPHVPAARRLHRAGPHRRPPTSTTRPTPTPRRSGREQAGELLDWFEPWHTVLEWDLPFAKWFVGGKLNASYNCLDRHVDAGHGDQVAYHWEGEPGDTRTITYARAPRTTSRQLANALKALGVREGRPGQHLPGHGARAADGAARVRAHRRRALGGVRRLLVRLAARPHQRRRGQGAHHRRRRVAARQHRAAEGDRRRRGRRVPVDREGARAAPHRARRRR